MLLLSLPGNHSCALGERFEARVLLVLPAVASLGSPGDRAVSFKSPPPPLPPPPPPPPPVLLLTEVPLIEVLTLLRIVSAAACKIETEYVFVREKVSE